MSACWASRSLRMVAPAVTALLLSTLAIPGAAEARRVSPDSVRIAKKITVNEQGIQIESADERVIRDQGSGRDRVRVKVGPDGVEVADHDNPERVRVKVGIDGVEVDAHVDTLAFDHTSEVVGPGIDVNVDESGIVRMFSDAEVPAGERVEGDVVAVFGDVHVEGQVSGNAVAVFGSVRMEPGAHVEGDAVAVGGVLDQPPGAQVGGESVSLGFLPIRWGAPSLGMVLGAVFVCWLVSLFLGWILLLLFPARMLRTAVTASRRTGGSLVLGLVSGPLLIIAIVLLLVTVIGIPVAFALPLVYLTGLWAGQLALTYALGCRLTGRQLGHGSMTPPLVAGTLFVATFFVLGVLLGRPEGVLRTIALFFHLLGVLLVMGLSVIGMGALLLSRMGTRPREIEPETAAVSGGDYQPATPPPSPMAPSAPYNPPATPSS